MYFKKEDSPKKRSDSKTSIFNYCDEPIANYMEFNASVNSRDLQDIKELQD